MVLGLKKEKEIWEEGGYKKSGHALRMYPVNCSSKKRVASINWRPFFVSHNITYATFDQMNKKCQVRFNVNH